MSLLDFILHYWQTDEQSNFTPIEEAIYFLVLKIANSNRWSSLVVPLDNGTVMMKLKIGRKVLENAQDRLVSSGLLTFSPGNGRGRPTSYTLIPPSRKAKKVSVPDHLFTGKVYQPAHLYDYKGVSASTPLFTPEMLKVSLKVLWKGHLFPVKPLPVKHLGASKIIDTIGDTIVSPVLPGAHEKPDPVFPTPEPRPRKSAVRKSVSQESPLYPRMLDRYNEWVKLRTDGMGAKIDGAQGNALKSIITYLRTQITARAEQRKETITSEVHDDRVLETWGHVLDNSDLLTPYLKGKTKLTDFNSEFQNILIRVRDELLRKQQSNGNTSGQAQQNGTRGGTATGLQGLKRN